MKTLFQSLIPEMSGFGPIHKQKTISNGLLYSCSYKTGQRVVLVKFDHGWLEFEEITSIVKTKHGVNKIKEDLLFRNGHYGWSNEFKRNDYQGHFNYYGHDYSCGYFIVPIRKWNKLKKTLKL